MADVLLTGTFTRLDGTPATGTVRVTPSRSPIMDPQGRVVISGPQTFPLDKDGKLAVEMPASNDPDLGPAFTYTVEALLSHNPWKISKVWIPHGSSTVDLSEIGDYTPTPGVATRVVTIPADGADGQVLVWDGAGFSWEDSPPGLRGPEGPRGPQGLRGLTGPQGPAIDINTGLPIQVDTTVGTRIFIGGHMVHGDTGWRRIHAWDNTGTLTTGDSFPTDITPIPGQAGFIQIRRTTNTVRIDLHRVRAGTNPTFALPAGFQPGGVGIKILWPNGILHARFSVTLTPGDYGTSGAPNQYSDQATFTAPSATWPTALPGTPA